MNVTQGNGKPCKSWWCEAPTVMQSVFKAVEVALGDVEDSVQGIKNHSSKTEIQSSDSG